MRKSKLIIAYILMLVVSVGICIALNPKVQPQPASAAKTECPAPTSEGEYFERAFDEDTGTVTCGFNFYKECPYAAAHSAYSPICIKLGEQQKPVETITIPDVQEYVTDPTNYTGK